LPTLSTLPASQENPQPLSESDGAVPCGGASFAQQLIAWQRSHGRNTLPWQNSRDPYRVWLSEIMLQQTQVATVVAYYQRFLRRFPDVASLAAAPLDDVLAAWSGLGYYARGRNLHRCAQVVMANHGGRFPPTSIALAELPGIGRSTAAAIAAFCFGEKVAILDGNVKRVLTRVLGFDGDLASAAAERELWGHATGMLPDDGEGIEAYTQGLMDLGATLCTQRSPHCLLCPVNKRCVALRTGHPERFPVKTRKLKRSQRASDWLLLQWQGKSWLTQRPPTGIWAGLWSLPEFEDLQSVSADWTGSCERQAGVLHVLTHLDWLLKPVVWSLPGDAPPRAVEAVLESLPAGRWFDTAGALALGLPAPLRRLLERQQGGC
jgi:A/G-specific adenine glycosylase